MDRSGDTRHQFDRNDPASVEMARDRFRELTNAGFRAVALERNGEQGRLLSGFDPQVERMLFIPQLKGG
jgi:hypothetical protein